MYRHILIATDGSELAEHAVKDGLSLAKTIQAKATVIMVVEPWLGSESFMQPWTFQEIGKYNEQMKKQATSVLNRAEDAAKQVGVSCDSIQVEEVRPYQAIITTAADRGCESHRHGIARPQRTIRSCAWQRDKQGADAHEYSGVGGSLKTRMVYLRKVGLRQTPLACLSELALPLACQTAAEPITWFPVYERLHLLQRKLAIFVAVHCLENSFVSPVKLLQ
jgi:universal stress protein family protein